MEFFYDYMIMAEMLKYIYILLAYSNYFNKRHNIHQVSSEQL